MKIKNTLLSLLTVVPLLPSVHAQAKDLTMFERSMYCTSVLIYQTENFDMDAHTYHLKATWQNQFWESYQELMQEKGKKAYGVKADAILLKLVRALGNDINNAWLRGEASKLQSSQEFYSHFCVDF